MATEQQYTGTDPLPPLALCTDARMLVSAGGTGVSSYARQLLQAHAAISRDHSLLSDRALLDQPAPAPLGRGGRWLRALLPGPRAARSQCGEAEQDLLV